MKPTKIENYSIPFFNKDVSLFNINFFLILIILSFVANNINAQTADLVIQKTGPNTIAHGAPMSYTITITNNGPSAVTGAVFNDPLPAFVSNVSLGSCTTTGGAICPISPTVTNSLFNGTVDLPLNSSVVITLNMDAPSTSYTGTSFSNVITIAPPSGITELDNNTNTSTWNTTLSGGSGMGTADISVIKSNNPTTNFNNSNLPGVINYSVTWTNNSTNAVTNVNLIDIISGQNEVYSGSGSGYVYYDGSPTNLVWSTTSSATSTPTGTFDIKI
jgi:uncharacterized repeat protein (TIGR01451 family)